MSPDGQAIVDLLRRAGFRTRVLRAVRSSAVAMVLVTVLLAFAGPAVFPPTAIGVSALLLVTIALIAFRWPRASVIDVAKKLERATPDSRNLLLTAAELLAATPPPVSVVAVRVLADATRVASGVNLARIIPAGKTVGVLAISLVVSVTSVLMRPTVSAARSKPVDPAAASIEHVAIEITPPEYAGRAAAVLQDPQRLEALAGSHIRIRVAAAAAKVRLETLSGSSVMTAEGGAFRTDVRADTDGYLAIVPVNTYGAEGPRRLIGVSITPDRSPVVRITAPARDLRVADGRRTLEITATADDDIGLATLRLQYTRVSGSGENFSFREGEVPLSLTKTTARTWTGTTRWPLANLGLEPGDMLIYRAVATDGRPGVPAAESDAFIVDIAAPGLSAADGFAIDDREDRYAISQQMVIVKTERLLGRRASMRADDASSEALDLAAEQRQVRAEFVFMMGGELADAGLDLSSLNEEVEAAGEDDLAAGRLANQGRLDIMRAIRSMSRAAAKLQDGDPAGALPIEKEALEFLQRAFSKSRYILRTLGARERLDLSRRMTGLLASLGRDSRPAGEAPPNPRLDSLRRLLADVAGVSVGPAGSSESASRLNVLAQRALAIDSGSAPLRDVAAKLTAFASALTAGREAARPQDEAVAAIAALVGQELPQGPGPTMPAALADLAGALNDALRGTGGRR